MLVPLGPTADPGRDVRWADEEQPARFIERLLEVGETAFAEIAQGHFAADRHPEPADVRFFDNLQGALDEDALVLLGVDAERDAAVSQDPWHPVGTLTNDEVEAAIGVGVPDRDHVWQTVRFQTTEAAHHRTLEKRVQLLRIHPTLASDVCW